MELESASVGALLCCAQGRSKAPPLLKTASRSLITSYRRRSRKFCTMRAPNLVRMLSG